MDAPTAWQVVYSTHVPSGACRMVAESSHADYSAEVIADRLRKLARSLDKGLARLVLSLPDFDRSKDWRCLGARSCISWLNSECGIHPSAGSERLRVGYALELLPIIRELFLQGELSWSKVVAITRIATPANERELARTALGMSASMLNRFVRQHRDCRTRKGIENEDEHALACYAKRALNFRHDPAGMVEITLKLPPLAGAAFLKSLARAEDELFNDAHGPLDSERERPADPGFEHEDSSRRLPRQLRADAAQLMAETFLEASLKGETSDMRTADRHQVMVHVDAATLRQTRERPDPVSRSATSCCSEHEHEAPPLRSYSQGGSAIAASTARRLTCDCSLSTIVMQAGEPLSIGRKSRVWPAAMRRAVLARDQCCQWPGCGAERFLDVHHVVHWADGGPTSAANGMACCSTHHRLLHEGGYTVERSAGGVPTERAVIIEVMEDGKPVDITLEAPPRRFLIRRQDGSLV